MNFLIHKLSSKAFNVRCSIIAVTCALFMPSLIIVGCSKKQTPKENNTAAGAAGSLELFQEGGEFGYRDITGATIVKPQFAEAGNFSWGLARIKQEIKGDWGYINASGEEVIAPQFEGAGDFVDGIAVVLSQGNFNYIGPDGSSLGQFDEDRIRKPLSVGDTLYVIHPDGLIARALGDSHAAAMGQLRPGEAVEDMYDPHPRHLESIDGLRGTWRLVRYQGKSGYLLDVYLSRYPRAIEMQPVERYRVVVSAVKNEDYSTYDLTKFASGGRLIVHNGPNWTETQEIVPDANVDQVVAQLKLYPTAALGSLVAMYNGGSETRITEQGDTIAVTVRRDLNGFLENLAMTRKNEETRFDVSISKYSVTAVEIVTTLTAEAADTETDPENEF